MRAGPHGKRSCPIRLSRPKNTQTAYPLLPGVTTIAWGLWD